VDLHLENKVVLVTGGAKGIGAAIVRAAAAEAAIPVIVDSDAEAGKTLHTEVRTSHVIVADLLSPAACQTAIDSTVEKFGRVDALVNNAGVNDKVGLEHGTPEQYAESLGRNLLHYFNMAHFALPYLKKTHGCIVNIGSKTAITGQGGTSGYASSKGAILALTREWAAELLGYRQWLDTFPDPERKLQSVLAKIPLEKRMTSPDEIAAMVVFLLSSRAAHITGQHLFVDGGYVHLDRALT
jgi:L-fucose dehydrogenase